MPDQPEGAHECEDAGVLVDLSLGDQNHERWPVYGVIPREGWGDYEGAIRKEGEVGFGVAGEWHDEDEAGHELPGDIQA